MKHFEEKVQDGEWDEVEKYLTGFTKVDDNRYSMKIFFEIKKQKYLEALDRQDKAKAIEILVDDLKVFSTFTEELYKEITQLITLSNFRAGADHYGPLIAHPSVFVSQEMVVDGKGTCDGEFSINRTGPNYDSNEEPYQLVGSTITDPLDESYSINPRGIFHPAHIRNRLFMLTKSANDLVVEILDVVDMQVASVVVDDTIPPTFLVRFRKALPESFKRVRFKYMLSPNLTPFKTSGETTWWLHPHRCRRCEEDCCFTKRIC
ncbi:hypothetical protein Fmac_008645 [Flemingia macrophylla]|uniref:CTLH domain-containing protein n=1 Tax=Flemingia macrophylla TaxID=520843 RepID=A0ABD1MY11_9FABA